LFSRIALTEKRQESWTRVPEEEHEKERSVAVVVTGGGRDFLKRHLEAWRS
jgi:hypothetical protein